MRAWMLVLPIDALLLMTPAVWNPDQVKATISMTVLSLLLITRGVRYRARLHLSVLDELPVLIAKLLTAAAAVATVTALRHQQEEVTKFLGSVVLAIALVGVGRVITTQIILWGRRRRITAHRTVLIGGGKLSVELASILQQNPRYGLAVVGFVDEGSTAVASDVMPRLGDQSDLDEVVRRSGADVLLIAEGSREDALLGDGALPDVVRSPACQQCDLLIVPRMHLLHTQTGIDDRIGSIPIMRILTPNLTGPSRLVKRAFDILVCGLSLVLLFPLLALCALAVRIEGGPGVIFRQTRVGRNGEMFECLKFRSMRPVDTTESATNWSIANDQRVGPVGRFLRRTSFDELPQLWNILRGDMTLVGPRPERPFFVEQFSAEYDRYVHRHRVRSGLTGLAQVSGLRGNTSIADRARYDNYYIENWSLWLDIKIILRTFSEIFFARGR